MPPGRQPVVVCWVVDGCTVSPLAAGTEVAAGVGPNIDRRSAMRLSDVNITSTAMLSHARKVRSAASGKRVRIHQNTHMEKWGL